MLYILRYFEEKRIIWKKKLNSKVDLDAYRRHIIESFLRKVTFNPDLLAIPLDMIS